MARSGLKLLVVAFGTCIAGLVLGEIDLVLWARQASVGTRPVAFAYLSEHGGPQQPLWIKYENSKGETFLSFSLGGTDLVQNFFPNSKVQEERSAFTFIQGLVEQEGDDLFVVQRIMFLGLELGSFHVTISNTGQELERGIVSLGSPAIFVTGKKPAGEMTMGPFRVLRQYPILLKPTVGRILWDIAHVVVAIVAVVFGILMMRTLRPATTKYL